jgi:hypothetical protein
MKAIRIMAFKPARTHGARPAARKRQAAAFVRLHEFDADPVAFFPRHLAGSAGRSPIELQLELGADELLVFDPQARATLGNVDHSALARGETAVDRHPCWLIGAPTGGPGLSAE